MTIRSNGQKRDSKRLLSALFLFVVAIICLVITIYHHWQWTWLLITAAMFYLSFAMFRSANEV